MINVRDVIKIKIPFPNIESNLAKQAHMYICCEKTEGKKLVKAQTYKPILETYLDKFLDSDEYLGEHPFNRRSLIDLDKYFIINGVSLPSSLKVKNNDGIISERFHNDIYSVTNSLNLCEAHEIENEQLRQVDRYLK